MKYGVPVPISQRYLAALDAYEEVILLRDLLDRIDQAFSWGDRQPERQREPFYLALGDRLDAEMRGRAWYVEVSVSRQEEARKAVEAAAERYKRAFRHVSLGRSDLLDVIHGLPHPAEVRRQVADRLADKPWWRWWGRRTVGFYGVKGGRIYDEPPRDDLYVALNIPDPSAALEYWRSRGASKPDVSSDLAGVRAQ